MKNDIIRVGADGSAGSRRALEWALREAELRNCAVEIVSAYAEGPAESAVTRRELAERRIHATMDDIIAGRVDLPTVSWHVVEGSPSDVLLRESERSVLLVMGSHGVGGLRRGALGSVADLCTRMSSCPVVVVPAPSPRTDDRADMTETAGIGQAATTGGVSDVGN